MFSSRRVACTRHADTRETDQVKQPAVFRLLDGGERERERRNWCALRGRRPHDKCIRAGRHAANEGRLRSFLPSFVSKVEACTRVKGSADGHGITALPASKSIFLLFLSLPFLLSIDRIGAMSFFGGQLSSSLLDRDGRSFDKEIERGDDKIG